MRKWVLALAALVVLAILGLRAPGAHAATCSVPSVPYPTIQSAVNDANCSTINVAAGTYAENVAIARSLSLIGPNVGVSGNGSRAAEATVSSINITTSNVTVDGFSFSNPGPQVNIFGTTTLSGIGVKDNIFSGYQSVGFPTYNAGNLMVLNNLFKTPLVPSEAVQIKADSSTIGGCSGTVVSGNVFTAASNNGGADANFSCTGSNSTGVTVSGNVDTGLADANGTSFTAFSGVVGGIVITNNHVTSTPTSGTAIFFFGGVTGTVDITNNVITGGGGNAVSVRNILEGNNTGAFTISNNDLSGNNRSVSLGNAFGSGASIAVHQNNVAGDVTAGVQNDSTSLVANATCNWWGSASGPGPVGPGTGDKVSSGVSYNPWLLAPAPGGACGDTVPPTFTCSASPLVLTPPDGSMRPVTVTLNASDAGSGVNRIVLNSVTSSQPITGADYTGFVPGTVYPASTTTVSGTLKATIAPAGHGRVYLINFSAYDNVGNQTICAARVEVRPH